MAVDAGCSGCLHCTYEEYDDYGCCRPGLYCELDSCPMEEEE